MQKRIDQIHSIDDFKRMKLKDMDPLAEEIREFIIENVSKTGGHLASNLGVVEMTLALHYVFNSPNDKIIWDVGHQSYVHKIITGRKNEFHTLRTFNGISGFPKRNESEHDIFETGHSSTSISAALGMARARDLKNENYSVVSVIGDGALSGGMAFEALNDAGHAGNKIIVVLNDNEMSISKNVGAMSSYLSKIRTNPKYTRVKKEIETFINRIPAIGRDLAVAIEKLKNSFKYLLVPGIFFEEIGFTYLGPVDGHNISKLVEVFHQAKKLSGPVFIHVLTKKGKGYRYAEENPEKFHGVGPFQMETGITAKKKPLSYSEVFGQHLVEMALQDERIVAITAAMPEGTGLTEFRARFPNRFFDVGIAEQHAVTMAAGMANAGMRPFFAVYSTFLQRAYDQILHDVCLQKLPVVIAIDRAGLVGEDGETHQGVFDISYLRQIPNITVMAPKDIHELRKMLDFSLSIQGPVAIRYPKGGVDLFHYHTNTELEVGKWEMLIAPVNCVILAVGRMVEVALKASELLKMDGILLGVVNARFIKPMDEDLLLTLSHHYSTIFTIEDNTLLGGFGSAVMEFYNKVFFTENPIHVHAFGIPDQFIPHGSVSVLLNELGLTPEHIAEKIKQQLNWHKHSTRKSRLTGM